MIQHSEGAQPRLEIPEEATVVGFEYDTICAAAHITLTKWNCNTEESRSKIRGRARDIWIKTIETNIKPLLNILTEEKRKLCERYRIYDS